jgi:hypothetical protein
VFLVGTSGTVLQMHSWSKFGETHFHPNFITASLIGSGPRVSVVIINHNAVVALTVTIPAATEVAKCKSIGELVALTSRGLVTGSTMAQRCPKLQ